MTIKEILEQAKEDLSFSSDTPLLDAEVLLAEALSVPRSYLFAYPEHKVSFSQKKHFDRWVEQRKQKTPVAYLIGYKEFWSMDLIVTRDTLIPRPETELLVDLVLEQERADTEKIIADLGTGSGAIALAIAHERPHWEIHATDQSEKALEVAKFNAKRLDLPNVIFHQGNWCEALPAKIKFDFIVSNPPYIAPHDPHVLSGNLRDEPRSALISEENGLSDIKQIIDAARHHLKPGGGLLLEHGFQQASEIRRIFENLDYSDTNTYQDIAGLDRITVAWYRNLVIEC